jgi:hypothetical protein
MGLQGMTSGLSAAVWEAAAAAMEDTELEQQQQQQWQHAEEQDGSSEQQAKETAAAAGLGVADADSFFAAEAADAFVERPLSFAARGTSLSLRQNELGRRSMPLPPLARNRSMGNIALPGASSPSSSAAGFVGSVGSAGLGANGLAAESILVNPVQHLAGGGSSLARHSAVLGRSSVSFSRCSASLGGGPIEAQLQRTSWLPRQGTGLFQGSLGR